MVWLILILAALLVLGPAYALLPSASQKRQMSMRREAMGEGIGVELVQIEDPDPDPEKYLTATGRPLDRLLSVAAYRLNRPVPQGWQKPKPVNWALIRSGHTSQGLPTGWQWQEENIAAADSYSDLLSKSVPGLVQFLKIQIDTLPKDVMRIDENNYTVSVYWHESESAMAIDNVIDFLKDCVNLDTTTLNTPKES